MSNEGVLTLLVLIFKSCKEDITLLTAEVADYACARSRHSDNMRTLVLFPTEDCFNSVVGISIETYF